MRALLAPVAVALLVAACTPAASAPAGAPSAGGSTLSRAPIASDTATVTGTAPSGAASASGSPVASAPTASPPAGSGTAGIPGLLEASPVASGPPLPPNPFELGGPAPLGSFVIGDSISLSVGPVLARLGYPVLGVVGQSTSETYLRTNLTSSTARAAPAWVIVLGTNNTADPSDVARLAGWVDVIDSLRSPDVRQKVYWVTPHRPPTYVGSKSRWTLDAFNAELKRLDAERRWLRIIDFDAVAKAHPEWFDQDTAMHLHPDTAGQGVLVALIAGPDAVPVEIPAPLFTGPPSPEPEPTTFVNTPPRTTPTPTPEPAPASPPTDAPSAPSTPVPLGPASTPSPAPSAPAAESAAAPATPS